MRRTLRTLAGAIGAVATCSMGFAATASEPAAARATPNASPNEVGTDAPVLGRPWTGWSAVTSAATDGQNALVAWTERTTTGRTSQAWVALVDETGTLLRRTHLGPGAFLDTQRVAFDGTRYVVAVDGAIGGVLPRVSLRFVRRDGVPDAVLGFDGILAIDDFACERGRCLVASATGAGLSLRVVTTDGTPVAGPVHTLAFPWPQVGTLRVVRSEQGGEYLVAARVDDKLVAQRLRLDGTTPVAVGARLEDNGERFVSFDVAALGDGYALVRHGAGLLTLAMLSANGGGLTLGSSWWISDVGVSEYAGDALGVVVKDSTHLDIAYNDTTSIAIAKVDVQALEPGKLGGAEIVKLPSATAPRTMGLAANASTTWWAGTAGLEASAALFVSPRAGAEPAPLVLTATAANRQRDPVLVHGGGRTLAVWEDNRAAERRYERDELFASYLDEHGAAATPFRVGVAPTSWSNGAVAYDASTDAFVVAVDQGGKLAFVWIPSSGEPEVVPTPLAAVVDVALACTKEGCFAFTRRGTTETVVAHPLRRDGLGTAIELTKTYGGEGRLGAASDGEHVLVSWTERGDARTAAWFSGSAIGAPFVVEEVVGPRVATACRGRFDCVLVGAAGAAGIVARHVGEDGRGRVEPLSAADKPRRVTAGWAPEQGRYFASWSRGTAVDAAPIEGAWFGDGELRRAREVLPGPSELLTDVSVPVLGPTRLAFARFDGDLRASRVRFVVPTEAPTASGDDAGGIDGGADGRPPATLPPDTAIPDATAPGPTEEGSTPHAASAAPAPGADGCQCDVAPRRASSFAWAGALPLLALAWRRRRRAQ